MKVAVITPYFKEPLELLQRCHASVAAQTHPDVVHVMIADGHPRAEVGAWPVRHLPLGFSNGDFGDTPRLLGAAVAAREGAEAIAFLDADNTYEPDHIEIMLQAQAALKAQVVTATRNLVRPDGSLMAVDTKSDGETYCDMNCFFLTRPAFDVLGAWGFKDPRTAVVDDYILWSLVTRFTSARVHVTKPTVNYTTMWALDYLNRGETPPPGARVMLKAEGEPYPKLFDYHEVKRLNDAGLPIVG